MKTGITAKIIGVAVIVAGQLLASALAAPVSTPSVYELMGRSMQISYSTTSLSGEPRLTYRDARTTLNFKGDEIRVAPTEIGQLVTVTLEQVPDLRTVTLTVLIPQINLDGAAAAFHTEAITTTHRTSIGGPALVRGPVQTYSAQLLRGKASQAVFIQPVSAINGVVTLSPTCPGPQFPGQLCEKPYANAPVQILNLAQSVVTRTVTDALGRFQAWAAPGSYIVHVDTGTVMPHCPDVPVTVPYSGSASVTVQCDTGIR